MSRALVLFVVLCVLTGCASGGGTSPSGATSSGDTSTSNTPASLTAASSSVAAATSSSTSSSVATKTAASQPAGTLGPSDQNNNPATPKVTANFHQPVMTNKWWSSLIWKVYTNSPFSENLYAHPLAFHAFADGLGVSYPSAPSIGNSGKQYEYGYAEDLRVGVPALAAPDARVDSYTDWTVTASVDDGTRGLLATIGHGLPYAYFQIHGGDAQINCAAPPTVWANNAEVVGLTVRGHSYALFAPAGSTWTTSGNLLRSTLGGKGWFSIAVLPDTSAATLEFYRQRAYAWVDGTSVSYTYDPAVGQVTTTYTTHVTVKESGHLDHALMALYRHQWLHTDTPVTAYSYASPRGQMKVVDAASFSTRLAFSGVLPNLPDMGTTDKTKLYAYVDAIYQEQLSGPLPTGDTYFIGKAMARLAHLVPIAEQVGHTRARDLFLQRVQAKLDDFFDGNAPSVFYYNAAWNTLIGYPASFGSETSLNDHHFHYGYFVMAAATVARYNPAWATANAANIKLVAADVANADRTNTQFPFLRFYDPYAGHCWASGPAPFASGNNQESSSESIDFSTAMILWGSATGDIAMRDEGVFLYANETDAIHQYWFDEDHAVFPSGYLPPTVGMVWSNGAAYSTWWTAEPDEIHGINFLPINGGSLHLGQRPAYVQANYAYLLTQKGGVEQEWRDIIWSFEVFTNPQDVMTKFLANAGYTPEGGETTAHTYHWLWNIAALGTPSATVTASLPTCAAFDRAGTRTYVAWNPAATAQTVRFSDGTSIPVAGGALVTQVGTATPSPSPSPSPTATPTPTPSPSPTATPTPTPTPSASPSPTPIPPPTASPDPTAPPSPTPTPTPAPVVSNMLYVLHAGALSPQTGAAAQTDLASSAGGRNFDGTPNQPLVYVVRNVTGTLRAGQATAFHLYVDAGHNVGDGVQARVSYDFNGDGTYDRVETYSYYPTNDLPDFEDYNHTRGVRAVSGSYADMRNGTVKLEVWNAIGTSGVNLRTDASTGEGRQSSLTLPFDVGGAPPTPTPTPTPSPSPGTTPSANTLYLLPGGALSPGAGTGATADSIAAAGGLNHDGTPTLAQVYLLRGVNGQWDNTQTTRFRLFVDAGNHVGDGVQVRVSYDFEGDGAYDRIETYNYFATNDVTGFEQYDDGRGLRAATGAFRNFTNAIVKVEVWCAIGRDPINLRTGATTPQGQQSYVRIPLR